MNLRQAAIYPEFAKGNCEALQLAVDAIREQYERGQGILRIDRRFIRSKAVPCVGYHEHKVYLQGVAVTDWMGWTEYNKWKHTNIIEVDV